MRLLGKFDCQVARVVFGKAEGCQTVEYAACQFIECLNEHLVALGKEPLENVWLSTVAQKHVEVASIDTESVQGVVQYDDIGNVAESALRQVVEKGVQPGVRLKLVHVATGALVVEVTTLYQDGSIVGLAVAEDGSCSRTSVTLSAVEVLKCETTSWYADFLSTWNSIAPAKNDCYRLSICKSTVVLAIDRMTSNVGELHLKVQTKPVKKLFADIPFKKYWLVLVCQSLKVVVQRKSDKVPNNAVMVLVPERFKAEFVSFVVPSNGDTFFCPAWHARMISDLEKANMIVEHRQLQVPGSSDSVGVPCFVNRQNIKGGEEIIVADPTIEDGASAKGGKRSGASGSDNPAVRRKRGKQE